MQSVTISSLGDATIKFSAQHLRCAACGDYLARDLRSYGCAHAVCSTCKNLEAVLGRCGVCDKQSDDIYYQDPWLLAVVITTRERTMRCGKTETGDVDSATKHTDECHICTRLKIMERVNRELSRQLTDHTELTRNYDRAITELNQERVLSRRLHLRNRLQASLTEAAEKENKVLKRKIRELQGGDVVAETDDEEEEEEEAQPSPSY